jgi:hypothetical protein
MSVMAMPLLDRPLEDKVMEVLREKPLRPTQLVQSLRRSGAFEREIESALSALLDDESVLFGSDGLLHTVQTNSVFQ